MKKLYLYIRLSDADDDLKFKTESESIANQRTLLYRFIRARREFDGYEVVEFIDMKTPSLIQFNDLRRLAGRGGKLRGQGG